MVGHVVALAQPYAQPAVTVLLNPSQGLGHRQHSSDLSGSFVW